MLQNAFTNMERIAVNMTAKVNELLKVQFALTKGAQPDEGAHSRSRVA
jgi:hypothetical protein